MAYYESWVASIVFVAFFAIFIFFIKRRCSVAMQFANVYTILITFSIFEISILNQDQPKTDAFTVTTALVATLSFVSYCKKELLLVYILVLAYMNTRSFFWIDGTLNFIRFTSYFNLAFIFIYFFSRESMRRERKLF